MDKSAILKLGEMDSELAALLQDMPPPSATVCSTVAEKRQLMSQTESRMMEEHSLPSTLKCSSINISMRDGHQSHTEIVQPKSAKDAPLVVLFYGGGFSLGSTRQMLPLAYRVAEACEATVVLPTYRLAPENPFPIGAQDAYDTVAWLGSNASPLSADCSAGFIVGGISSGASLAAVVVAIAKGNKLMPAITGQYLSIPAILDHSIVPEKYRDVFISREQNKDAPGFNAAALEEVLKDYNPDFHSPWWSPLNSDKIIGELPPACFQVCGLDPVRDDALIYEDILKEKGIRTKCDIYPGLPHAFWVLAPQLESAEKVARDEVEGIKWLLENGKPSE